jgi:hypothetical protein
MIISGRVYDIVKITDNVYQIILRKKDRGNYELSALTIIGWWKDKALNEAGLQVKDKIKAKFRIKSKEYKGKYYTEAICREIYIVEKAPVKFDKKTGELFDS